MSRLDLISLYHGWRRNRRVKVPGTKDIRLDLGSGQSPKEGFVGLDIREYGQEILWNAEDGIPLPDESVSEIFSSHFIEHIASDKIMFLMGEVWRIMAPGAVAVFTMPHSECQQAFYPAHKSYWNESVVNDIVRNPKGEGAYLFKLIDLHRDGISLFFTLGKVAEGQ